MSEISESKRISHDSLFKLILQNKESLKSFITTYLPKKLPSTLDLDSVKNTKDSFVDDDMKSLFSDVVCEAKINGKNCYICILIEHQSSPDYWMAYRLFGYMYNFMKYHRGINPKSKTLPHIYPIVFYNGKRKWKYSTDFFDLFPDKSITQEFFNHGFNLIDLSQIPNHDIRKQKSLSSILSLMMKNRYDRNIDLFIEFLKDIQHIIKDQQLADQCTKLFLCYYNINKHEFKKIKNEVTDMPMARFAQQFMEEGEAKGVKKGIQHGIQKTAINMLGMGLPIHQISKATELSQSEIEKLKREKRK